MSPWYLGISNFLEESSSLSPSVSLHCSLMKAFLSLLAILWNSAFSCVYLPFLLYLSLLFFSQLFVRPPQTTILPSCISFPWRWFGLLPPVQCCEPPSMGFSRQEYWSGVPWPSPEEISSLSHSVVSSISLHWSLKKAFLSLLAILWNSTFRC